MTFLFPTAFHEVIPPLLTRTLLGLSLLLASGALAQSTQVTYYADSTVKATGAQDSTGMVGVWTYYYPSGVRSAVEHYRRGQLHGTVRYYHPSGTLVGRRKLGSRTARRLGPLLPRQRTIRKGRCFQKRAVRRAVAVLLRERSAEAPRCLPTGASRGPLDILSRNREAVSRRRF